MVLVAADAVEAERLGVLELVQVLVVDVVALLGIVERAGDVDPHGTMLGPEIIRQVGPRHQVEPREFHRSLREPGLGSRRSTRDVTQPRGEHSRKPSTETTGAPRVRLRGLTALTGVIRCRIPASIDG